MRPMEVYEEEEEEEEAEEEEYERPHKYDEPRYTEIVNLINEEPTSSPDNHARRVVDKARRIKQPLNLMNDSVLHEVITRRKTRLAVAIVDLPDALNHSILRHQNYYGDTPLHFAVEIGDSTVVNALLRRDEMLARKKNRKGEMALHIAVQFGHPDLFDFIIKVGGREMVYDRTDDGFTILHYAIMRNQTKIALDIAKKFPELILTRNAGGASPLQMMAVYFRKPPKTGILNSLLYKYIPLEKGTSLEEGMTDEESGGIMPPDQGNWWSRLSVISNLRKRIVKAREGYEMTMELLKLLLVVRDFDFYIRGFTPDQSSTKHLAGGSYIRPRLRVGKYSIALIEEEDTDRPDEAPQENGRIRWEESPLITGIKLSLDHFVIKILQVRPELATCLDYDGTNLLQAAVKYGRRRVVKAIKEDKKLPLWLLNDLESGTNNTLLHIAASNTLNKEADPLRLQDELEWFEMLKENIVPKHLWDYRNRRRMTAREVFDEKHEVTLKYCKEELAKIGQTCSPLVAAVVFTSSFYIPGENNRESNRLAFKIFSHVYVVGFSCAATSLIMFLLLVVTPYRQQDFRRLVPRHYLIACLLLAMSLVAFIVAFACNVDLQIYGQKRNSHADLVTLLPELLIVPFLCALALFRSGAASCRFGSLLRRLTK